MVTCAVVSRRVAWTVALLGALTMTVSQVDRTMLAVLAPSVTKALEISETAYGWLTSAFSIAYLVAVPLSGWWIDRAGARRGLLTSVWLWSGVAALHALVPGFATLFMLRIALGIAEGPSFPGAAQTVYRMLPADERSRGFGLLFTGSSLGAMLAAPLASLLYDAGGWRVAFLGTAMIGLAWVPLWRLATRAPAVRAQLDARPTATATTTPPTFRTLVTHPMMVRALIAILAVAPVVGFGMLWTSKYLVRAFQISQGAVGHYVWLPPLGFDAGALLFGDLAARHARRSSAPPRLLFLIAAALASTIACLPLAETAWSGVAIVSLSLVGGGAIYTLVTTDLLARMPSETVSFAGGIMTGAQSVALIAASPLIGRSVDAYQSFDTAAVVLGAVVIPGSAIWLAWRTPR